MKESEYSSMFYQLVILIALAIALYGLVWVWQWYQGKTAPSERDTTVVEETEAVAYFAGGCFWCTESDYEKLEGVRELISGYMGGEEKEPSYNDVASGKTGHRESIKVVYDPRVVSYRQLVLTLFRHSDPTDADGSFYDRGEQYTSAIYYQTQEENEIADSVIRELEEKEIFNKPIATQVEPAGTFWIAEEYHQDYYKKNPLQYSYYRTGSGRDVFTNTVWDDETYESLFTTNTNKEKKDGMSNEQKTSNVRWEEYQKPDDKTLKETLTDLQYYVTQKEGTETPFQNEYWDNHEEGIYVDIVSGEPLFSSTDKFDSGTGWPSFLKPIDNHFVTEHKDFKLIIPRTEIRSRYADSHLGHIILDGPEENDKIRYCMNSAALRFIPKEKLEEEGLGEYITLFN